jgi:multicomponent Na+:H+ antiporter subunit D
MTGTALLHRLGGLQRRAPFTALLFMLAALSLAGLPPFSGFFGKLALIQAGLAEAAWTITAVSLGVSLLTLFSMLKIWAGVFWGDPDEEPPLVSARGTGPLRAPILMNAATAGLVLTTLAIGIWAQPLWELCVQTAAELLDPRTSYVAAVLGP